MLHPLANNQYVSLEPLLDMEQLVALHPLICRGIAKSRWRLGSGGNGRQDGLHDLNVLDPKSNWHNPAYAAEVAGLSHEEASRYLLLTHPVGNLGWVVATSNQEYTEKHDPTKIKLLENRKHFTEFYDWLDEQHVFTTYGRVVFFITSAGVPTPVHHDYYTLDQGKGKVDEFIWFCPAGNKQFGLYGDDLETFELIRSRAAWFNNAQYHGGAPIPPVTWCYSVRVDGTFSHKTREYLRQNGVDW